MENLNTIIESIKFRDDTWIFLVPFSLMVFDILTGVIHAWAIGHLKSYRMREGLSRKFAEISILVIVQIFVYGMNVPKYILAFFSLYVCFMEIVSLCENLKKMGVKLPKFIDKALVSMEEQLQNGIEFVDKDDKDDKKDKEV